MTQLFDKSFGDLDKFPVCGESNCVTRLELQDRFKCGKCQGVFCCAHRHDFAHGCPSLKSKLNDTKSETQVNQEKPIQLPKCAEFGCRCKLTETNKFFCTRFGKSFCMAHRLDFVHTCRKK